MSRGRWFALLLLALWATTAPARTLKPCYYWPARFMPREVVQIPVFLDVGHWIAFTNQEDTIKLEPVNSCTYEGRLDLEVRCNFNLSLSCTITPTGVVDGRYSCFIENGDVDAPGGTARVYARLQEANLASVVAGTKDLHVATVTIQIRPRL